MTYIGASAKNLNGPQRFSSRECLQIPGILDWGRFFVRQGASVRESRQISSQINAFLTEIDALRQQQFLSILRENTPLQRRRPPVKAPFQLTNSRRCLPGAAAHPQSPDSHPYRR